MLNQQLIQPRSIAIIGASNNIHKPGGKILKNITDGNYNGKLYPVNPHENEIQGIPCFNQISLLPDVDMAVVAVPAIHCIEIVKELAQHHNTKAFIVISAGFAEEGREGAALERHLADIVNENHATLIGPNCTGVITVHHQSIFTSPIPKIDPKGCDLISGSGATAAYIIESAMMKGLRFSSVFSVGNSAQTGIEEILEYMDVNFNKNSDSLIKLIYIENIRNPDKLLQHASSLINKGCKIAAIKAGSSPAGIRAAASHTGAMASSDSAVEALFRKAGIVRCYSREELTTIACVFTQKEIKGNRIAIITHAGGPAVMLTDVLSRGGLEIPELDKKIEEELLSFLNYGASARNPIDLLATGTAEQLSRTIEICESKAEDIDAMMVIFGSPGLSNVFDAYEVIDEKMKKCKKPIYPILPSLNTAKEEVDFFLSKGHVNFPDEVTLANAIIAIHNTPRPSLSQLEPDLFLAQKVKELLADSKEMISERNVIKRIFELANVPLVKEFEIINRKQLLKAAGEIGFPLVLKISSSGHKTEVGGVSLDIRNKTHLLNEFKRLKKISSSGSLLVQPYIKGIELFIGARYEPRFGHIILFGMGGIFVEVLKDVSTGLAPLSYAEAVSMIKSVKIYPIIKGFRGNTGVNEDLIAQLLMKISYFLRHATQIKEMDINPLIVTGENIFLVDVRVLLENY